MITNLAQVEKILRTSEKDAIAQFKSIILNAMREVNDRVLIRTAVWEGETINNYHWTVDTAYSGGLRGALGSGDPGDTGSMPLGSEPRRPENEANARAELARVMAEAVKDPYHKFIMSNPHWKAGALEFGKLPRAARSRNPAGMVRVTAAEIRAEFAGK